MKFEQDPPGRVKLKHLISAALNLLILSSRISHERDPVHVQCGLVVSWSCGLMDSAQSTQLNPDYSQLAAAEPFPHQPQPAHRWGAAKVTVLASELLSQCWWTPRVGFLSPSSNSNIYTQLVVSNPFSQCRGTGRDNRPPLNIPVGWSLPRGTDHPSIGSKGSREQVQVQTPALPTSESRGHEYHPETF